LKSEKADCAKESDRLKRKETNVETIKSTKSRKKKQHIKSVRNPAFDLSAQNSKKKQSNTRVQGSQDTRTTSVVKPKPKNTTNTTKKPKNKQTASTGQNPKTASKKGSGIRNEKKSMFMREEMNTS
jgi:hypothetical protein